METNILEIFSVKYQALILIFLRVTGLFILSPVFSRNGIPNTLRIGFSVLLSITLVNVIDIPDSLIETKPFLILAMAEVLIGLMIGLISYLYFNIFFLAGQIIDFNIGFSMVNVFDPQSNTQVPIMGSFYNLLATTIFLTLNGDHILIEGLLNSYDMVSIGSSPFHQELLTQYTDIMGKMFIWAFKISAPIMISIFLADVFLGILAKTMPQMNVFIVGMPLKILVGLAIIIITLPMFGGALYRVFELIRSDMNYMFEIMGSG